MNSLPVVPDDVRAEALHGSWCPKLCNHACPVLAATGRNDAVPWGFHRTVTDLADGRISPDTARDHLVACSGCLGCQVPCEFDQDVPAQVRAGRAAVAAAGHPVPGLDAARDAVADGDSPYGWPRAAVPEPPASSDVTVVVGCRDGDEQVAAVAALFEAAGVAVRFTAPDGCCGATLRDLGAVDDADARSQALRADVGGGPVVALDPHCLPELGDGAVDVLTSLVDLLDEGRLAFEDEPAGVVAYHDPCLLARAAVPVTEAPRRLLRAAGYVVAEPEGTGSDTACAGSGLGLELVDEAAAEATARRRRDQLAATGAARSATACEGARRRLAADGSSVGSVFTLLAARLRRTT